MQEYHQKKSDLLFFQFLMILISQIKKNLTKLNFCTEFIFINQQDKMDQMISQTLDYQIQNLSSILNVQFKLQILLSCILQMSYKSTQVQDVNYLKQDNIGKIIALGLTKLYQQHPDKPVTYLAHWLLTYSSNQKKISEIKKQEQQKQKNGASYQKQIAIKIANQKKANQQKKAHDDIYQSFLTKITNHEYHNELLTEQLPQFLEKYLNLTGVYIGQLNHPFKKITEQDQDYNAHLNLDSPKCINYIGSSKSHSKLMLGKILPLDKGVTGQVFTLNTGIAEVQGVQGTEKKQPKKFVYVPDVVKNEKIHYFRLPKLGAYIAIPLVCKTYLLEKSFDEAFEAKKNYLEQLEQFQKQKQTKLQAVYKELQDFQNKLKIFQDRNEQQHASNIKQQITQAQQRKDQIEKQMMEEEQHQYKFQNRQFVLCADTLGQDKEISPQIRQFLFNFTKKFEQEWNSTQLRLLKQNINHQLQYEKKITKSPQEIYEQINKELEIQEQLTKQITLKHEGHEKKINHEILSLKHERLKAWLNKSSIKQLILHLKKYRILKFPEIIQNALYFIGYKKDVVDIQNKTHLNWKYVQNHLLNDALIQKLLDYQYSGQKKQSFKSYEKVHTLLATLQNLHENNVFHYNVGYGVLLKFLKNVLELRIEDIQIRHEAILEAKTLRAEKIAENQKIAQQKATVLQSQRSSELFNEEEWSRTYDEQHPLINIPEEVVEHIDNDL